MRYILYLIILLFVLLFQKILAIEPEEAIITVRESVSCGISNPFLFISPEKARERNILSDQLNANKYSQHQLNSYFSNIIHERKWYIVDFLLTPDSSQLRPDSVCINNVLSRAVTFNDAETVAYLINLDDTKLRPEVWGLNEALWRAVMHNKIEIVELLLNPRKAKIFPDKNGINNAYVKAVKLKFSAITNILLQAL